MRLTNPNRNRPSPTNWHWSTVVETEGCSIGFEVQEPLLTTALKYDSTDLSVVLMGDRFYGTSALIGWCQQAGWGYRLRLKRNLDLVHEAGLWVTLGGLNRCFWI